MRRTGAGSSPRRAAQPRARGRLRVITQSWTNSRRGFSLLIGCLAGNRRAHVTTQGDLTPCDFTPLSFGRCATPRSPICGRACSTTRPTGSGPSTAACRSRSSGQTYVDTIPEGRLALPSHRRPGSRGAADDRPCGRSLERTCSRRRPASHLHRRRGVRRHPHRAPAGPVSGLRDQGRATTTTSMDVDAWVLQQGSADLLFSYSVLPEELGDHLEDIYGVDEAVPYTARQVGFKIGSRDVVLYVVGFDPDRDGPGPGPVAMVAGTSAITNRQIVVDKVFAQEVRRRPRRRAGHQRPEARGRGHQRRRRHGGVPVRLRHPLARAQAAGDTGHRDGLPAHLRARTSRPASSGTRSSPWRPATVKSLAQMIKANRRVVNEGFLPVLGVLLVIGFFIGVAVIGLTIYSAVLEHRREYGVLKAVGARTRQMLVVVAVQAIFSAVAGYVVGVGVSLLAAQGAEEWVPQFITNIVLARPRAGGRRGAPHGADRRVRSRCARSPRWTPRWCSGHERRAHAATGPPALGRVSKIRQRSGAGRRAHRRRPAPRPGRAGPHHRAVRLRKDHAAHDRRGHAHRPAPARCTCTARRSARRRRAELAHVRLMQIGFVFQSFNLFPALNALDNVALPASLAGVSARKRRRRAAAVLGAPGTRRTSDTPPRTALRRREAARGAGAGAHQRPAAAAGRRTHRQSGLQERAEDAGAVPRDRRRGGAGVLVVTHDARLIEGRTRDAARGRAPGVEAPPAQRQQSRPSLRRNW